MTTDPVSVVMPVHNAVRFLDQAIASITEQTFGDFEFVIFDDASDDGSSEIIRACAARDPRIKTGRSEIQLGMAESSNAAVRYASGRLIARMDADDISHPERLARQTAAMADPSVVVVGALADGIDELGRTVRPRDSARLLRANHYAPFPHGSAMFRLASFDAVGGYRELCDGWEDTDLFLRLARRGRMLVLVDALYSYRYHGGNSSVTFDHRRRLEGLAREQACILAYADDGQYEHAVARPVKAEVAANFALQAWASASALSVWAARRPARMPDLRKLPAGGWQRVMLRCLLYRTWGTWSPRSLRTCMAKLVGWRDRRCMKRIGGRTEVEWCPRP